MSPKELADKLCDECLVGLKDRIGTACVTCIETAIIEAEAGEREACAKIAESNGDGVDPYCCKPLAEDIADAIRARKGGSE